jgi:hypothetical protein
LIIKEVQKRMENEFYEDFWRICHFSKILIGFFIMHSGLSWWRRLQIHKSIKSWEECTRGIASRLESESEKIGRKRHFHENTISDQHFLYGKYLDFKSNSDWPTNKVRTIENIEKMDKD